MEDKNAAFFMPDPIERRQTRQKTQFRMGICPCGEQAVRPNRIATERLKHVALPVVPVPPDVRPNRIATERLKPPFMSRSGGVGARVRPNRIATERLKLAPGHPTAASAGYVRPNRIATERLKQDAAHATLRVVECQTEPNRDRAIETTLWDTRVSTSRGQTEPNRDRAIETSRPRVVRPRL